MLGPAEIKQHDVAASEGAVLGFPLGNETPGHIITFVKLPAVEAHAPADQARQRDLLAQV